MASIKRLDGKDGASYKITVSMGRDVRGKQIRHYMTWKPEPGMTARQIEKKVKQVAVEFEKQLEYGFQTDNRQTFDEYARYVVEMRTGKEDSRQTTSAYTRFLKRLSPLIGSRRIKDIRPPHIRELYKELSKPGSRRRWGKAVPIVDFKAIAKGFGTQAEFAEMCGLSWRTIQEVCQGRHVCYGSAEKIAAFLEKPIDSLFDVDKQDDGTLSPRTLQLYHSFLCTVFRQAEMDMIISINPMERVQCPYAEPHEPNYFQPEQVLKILEAADKEPILWRAMVHLFVVSGARRGELLALKWHNIDFDRKQIKIDSSLMYIPETGLRDGPTKTRNTRFVPLPAETFTILRKYRLWQLERRMLYGDQWQESPYVFTGERGGPMYPTSINAWLRRFADRHGLPHINPHAFRHTAASIMISEGVDIVSVSKMLGHATTTTTMEVYAHAVEDAKRNAAECIADTILRKKA